MAFRRKQCVSTRPQGESSGYDVIFDRISQDIPFYRTWLKNAALMGAAVINNPFWWSADDKYFNNCLMTQVRCSGSKNRDPSLL
jgi:glutathione synthase/RimK-type ligase-like ATP-grasp enzyme